MLLLPRGQLGLCRPLAQAPPIAAQLLRDHRGRSTPIEWNATPAIGPILQVSCRHELRGMYVKPVEQDPAEFLYIPAIRRTSASATRWLPPSSDAVIWPRNRTAS